MVVGRETEIGPNEIQTGNILGETVEKEDQ